MRSAATTASIGISMLTSSTSAAAIAARKPSTAAGVSSSSAPGAITMLFSPRSSTRMKPTMVAPAAVMVAAASTPSRRHSSRASRAWASSPSAVSRLTSAPSRAAAMAWFDPLPPGPAA
jgi:hypothetical protein